ncbi:hypothetical protein DB346_14945 [Verrucomicrobia bacterium LW23]|nr:hypothetical protein DB346_14945 [Verrucomicrobia bacterium LW23]
MSRMYTLRAQAGRLTRAAAVMRACRAGVAVALALAALVLILAPVPAEARFTWRTARVGQHEYVTLQSFCEFYRLPYRRLTKEETFSARNGVISVSLKHGSGIAVINGVKYTLSYDITSNEEDWLISRIDIIKLFEPVIRPQNIQGFRPVQGVVIDPGHGGGDKGATTRGGGTEKAYAFDTALRLEQVLKKAGVKVVMTRRSDVFIELHERAEMASQYKDYIFVSLHYNSASTAAYGLETYCCSPRGATSTQERGEPQYKDFMKQYGNMNDGLNILLAHEIHRQIIQLYPNNPDADRGVKRARFAVLRLNHLPSVLVELGFLSNRMDASLVDSPVHRQRLAERVAAGIFAYMARSGGPTRRIPSMQMDQQPNLRFGEVRTPTVRNPDDPVPPGGLSPETTTHKVSPSARDIPAFTNGGNRPATPTPAPATPPPPGPGTPVSATPPPPSATDKEKGAAGSPPPRTVDVPTAKAEKEKGKSGARKPSTTTPDTPVFIYPVAPIMEQNAPARMGGG